MLSIGIATTHQHNDLSIAAEIMSNSQDLHEELLEIKIENYCPDGEESNPAEYQDESSSNEEKYVVEKRVRTQLPKLQTDISCSLMDFLPDSNTPKTEMGNTDKNGNDSLSKIDNEGSVISVGGKDKSVINGSCTDKVVNKSGKSRRGRKKNGVEKKFFCDICGKDFKRSTYVTIHKRVHTGDRPYVCQICNVSFRHSSHLAAHKRSHTGAQPFLCKTCPKRFSHNSSLITHMKTHTGAKPFACDICQKKFFRRTDLKTHSRTHSGEKPYSCDICSKKFNHVSHLITHKRTHSKVQSYPCGLCKRMFRNDSNLNRHMVTVHKDYILGM